VQRECAIANRDKLRFSATRVAFFATQINHFALAQKRHVTHIDHAFQASSPKNFIGSAFGLALFLSGWPVGGGSNPYGGR
jgi:hypothetical protein